MADTEQTAPMGHEAPDADLVIGDATGEVAAMTVTATSAETFGEYARAWFTRIRSGDTGSLPVVVGLIVLGIIFQSQDNHFLTARNLTTLMPQGAEYILLAFGIIFVLLLGEIDLSVGYVGYLAGIITAELLQSGHSWEISCLAGIGTATAIGLVQGLFITILGLPSFIVTLAGYLGWQGVALLILGNGGTVPIKSTVVNDFAAGSLTPTAGWIITLVGLVLFAGTSLLTSERRRRSGLATPPITLTILKIAVVAVVAIGVMIMVNRNRGTAFHSIRGLPWVALIVVGALALWTFVLTKLRFGRYVYAIGGNAEAARRAGINLVLMRTSVFGIAGLMAGIAGIVAASRLESVSTSSDGGTAVLYCIAAAVIGGTSLFGGRGRAIHALLGGLVIAGIYNGMGLLNITAAKQYIVTALVLLAAVAVDAIARRGRTNAGVV